MSNKIKIMKKKKVKQDKLNMTKYSQYDKYKTDICN